jgi:FkbM family methyltransferase
MSIKDFLHKIFSDKNLAGLPKTSLNRKISLLDIGARGGVGWPWDVASSKNISIILVEPDLEEVELLKAHNQYEILPYALWSKEEELTLNINHSPGTSSVFTANMDFLNQFDDSGRFKVRDKLIINTKTIDSLANECKLTNVDFAKIDVQGAELAILQGGENFFRDNLVGLEVEVEFSQIYKEQPLFSDVDVFVREKLGLELWDIRKSYWKYKQKEYKPPLKGRLIFGDALFLRPVSTLDAWLLGLGRGVAIEKLHMLIVTTIAYGYLDYTSAILRLELADNYLSKSDKRLFSDYVRKLSKSFYPFANGSLVLYKSLNILANSFKPNYKGWASSEENIGSRKKSFFWL